MSSTPHRIIGHLWSVICWIVLSGLTAGGAVALYYYQRADDEVRTFVERKLHEFYPELDVRVGSAELRHGTGVRIGQLAFARRTSGMSDPPAAFAYAESILIECTTALTDLAQGHFEIQKVRVEGLRLQAERRTDGHWSWDDLIPAKLPPCRSARLPQIELAGGAIELRDSADEPGRQLELEDVRLQVQLKRLRPPQPDCLPELLIGFQGSTRTSFCRQIALKGAARTTDGAWSIQADMQEGQWTPETGRQLPSYLARHTEQVAPLRGQLAATVQLGAKSRQLPLQYAVDARLSDGSWQDPNWPQVITDVQCDVHVDSQRFEIRELSARAGTATMVGRLQLDGHTLNQPFHLQAQFDRFPITRELVADLPRPVQQVWQKYQAVGTLSGDLAVQYDGQRYEYNAALQCHDASIRHFKFPYPLTECEGTLRLADDELQFQLTGAARETPVHVEGQIRAPGEHYTGWWEVKTGGAKTIDDDLLAAMPRGVSEFVTRLQPRGAIQVWVRSERQAPDERVFPQIEIRVKNGSINYDRFPYPLSNVRGQIASRNGVWQFTELTGENDNGTVRCDGDWDTTAADAPLNLTFVGKHVSLDTELRRALPTGAQEAWRQLRPQGQLNDVKVRFFHSRRTPHPEISVDVRHTAQDDHDTLTDAAEGLQITPTAFPLRLANVHVVEARFSQGAVRFRGLTCEHGPMRFRLNGSLELPTDGGWTLNLTELAADNVDLRQSMLDALPPPLTRSLRQLQVNGIFALAGAISLSRPSADDELSTSWRLRLDADRGSLNFGLPVENIFGQIELDGESQGTQFWNHGELALDSIMCQRVQVSQVTGPFLIDNEGVVFGQRVPPAASGRPSAPLVGSVYQGKISAQAEVSFARDTPFNLQANVTNADVSLMARDWKLGQGNLSGQAMLELILTGTSRGRDSLKGEGTAQLTNANLYELPLILALWGRLSSNDQNASRITSSDLAFKVGDGYVYFDRFDLNGDAVTLKGIGEMGLNRDINLDFYTIIGREQLWSPLVRPFLGEASRQFLQIHVDGTLSDPRTTPEVMPVINETLQRLFPEAVAPAPRAASRSLPPFTPPR